MKSLRKSTAKTCKRLLMGIIKPIAPILSDKILLKIPVIGLVTVKLPDGKKLRFKTDGYDYTASLLYWRGIGAYEPKTLSIFFTLLPFTDTFFDIGANTGIFSLIAAIYKPQNIVYGFEPVPRIASAFRENVWVNNLKNLEVICGAVTDYDGKIEIHIPPGRVPTGATTNPGTPTLRSEPDIVSVKAIKLDTFIDAHKLSVVDIIKIDTETTEPLVLQGALRTLKNLRPIIICEVLHGRTESQLQSILESIDYRYFWISGKGLIEIQKIEGHDDYMNYLFLPGEKAEGILKKLPKEYSC